MITEKFLWKNVVHFVRTIEMNDCVFRIGEKELEFALLQDMWNGCYEAGEVSEGFDGFCDKEDLQMLSDDALYELLFKE